MSCLRLAILSVWLSLSPSLGAAQDSTPLAPTIGPSGEAYQNSLGYRGIDAEVRYFDPAGKLPALDTAQEVAPVPEPRDQSSTDIPAAIRIVLILLAAGLLIGLALLVVQGNFALSMGEDAQNPARGRRPQRGQANAVMANPADLQAILATSDRRLALVMLVQAALARTVAMNGVLLQPSWTLRDALGHIPRGQAHLDALRALVMAGERVLFGNRDVTEADFQAHVDRVRPLMVGTAP